MKIGTQFGNWATVAKDNKLKNYCLNIVNVDPNRLVFEVKRQKILTVESSGSLFSWAHFRSFDLDLRSDAFFFSNILLDYFSCLDIRGKVSLDTSFIKRQERSFATVIRQIYSETSRDWEQKHQGTFSKNLVNGKVAKIAEQEGQHIIRFHQMHIGLRKLPKICMFHTISPIKNRFVGSLLWIWFWPALTM